jgi:anti-sigma factor RsiW
MDCEMARGMIEAGRGEGLAQHLDACPACRREQALWGVIGEAAGEAKAEGPGPDFTERVMARVREEERRDPWRRLRDLIGPERLSGTLDEFSDFPPDSFGAFLFGDRRAS